jgi:hypothetical protein
MRSFLAFLRSPPSSSYGTFLSSLTRILRPRVTSTNGDFSGLPAARRPNVRAHCTGLSAVTSPTSMTPSSGLASPNTSTPPNSLPTFPTSTQESRPL